MALARCKSIPRPASPVASKPDLLVLGRVWVLLLADCAWILEHLAGDGFGLRDAVDGVGEARVVAVAEGEGSGTHLGANHFRGIERHRIECRPGGRIQRAGV